MGNIKDTSLLGSRLSRQIFIITLLSILFVEALIAVPYANLKKEEILHTISDQSYREFSASPTQWESDAQLENTSILGIQIMDEDGKTLSALGRQIVGLKWGGQNNAPLALDDAIEVFWHSGQQGKHEHIFAVLKNNQYVDEIGAIHSKIILFGISILIFGTLLIFLIAYTFFIKPIITLKNSLLNARKELETQNNGNVPIHNGNEIRQIAQDIDQLINQVAMGSQSIQTKERERKGTDEQYKAIFNSSFLPIVLLDFKNYKILEANKATYDLLGFADGKIENFDKENFTLETISGFKNFVQNVLEQGSTMVSELTIQKNGEKEIILEGYGSILKFANTPCILLIARDKRPWIEAEQELTLARQKAEYASQTKTNFLANMSHELRTPLTSINGFSKMIIDEAFGPIENERYKEYIENILESGTHLLDIINDILDISRIEAGEMQLREQSVDFSLIVSSCIKLVQNRAQKKNLEVISEIPDNLPMIWADQRLLKQITLNLLSNSLKFTKKGTVTLGAEMLPDDRFRFYVKDTGIGISTENINKALQPFGRIDTGLAKHIDGSGLGLPLSHALTNLHGGILEIGSKEGVGTTVYVTLPSSRVEWVD